MLGVKRNPRDPVSITHQARSYGLYSALNLSMLCSRTDLLKEMFTIKLNRFLLNSIELCCDSSANFCCVEASGSAVLDD